jgi:N-acetylglucosaminyl-diphospho-decaprenol L-rhamnosyltransferase
MPPDLTIVFVNYNSTGHLRHALDSLARAEPGARIERLVVDNHSSDRSDLIDVCRDKRARLLLLSRNVGIGAAANRGFRHARGRLLAVANTDLEFSPGVVRGLVDFMDAEPAAGVAGPQFLYADGRPQPSARRLPRLRYVLAGRRSVFARLLPRAAPRDEFLYRGIDAATKPVPVESVIGAFMVFRRDAFLQAGGFDESYFMYAEDMDICRRVGRAWRVFTLPYLRMVHLVGGARIRYHHTSEFHRVRSHRKFFLSDAGPVARVLLNLLFSFYLAALEGALFCGLGEPEYSWTRAVRR